MDKTIEKEIDDDQCFSDNSKKIIKRLVEKAVRVDRQTIVDAIKKSLLGGE